MSNLSSLRNAWGKAAGYAVGVGLATMFAAAAVKRNEIWGWDWEKISYITTSVASVPVVLGVLPAILEWRKNRLAQERENEIEAEENDIERTENEIRLAENRIRVQDLSQDLDAEYRKEQRWYADYLREGKAHDFTERTHYSNLLNIVEKGHMLFIHPKDSSLVDMKDTWIDTIDEIVEDPGFVKTLVKNPTLLVGENPHFVKYFVGRMQSKWSLNDYDTFMNARVASRREPSGPEYII